MFRKGGPVNDGIMTGIVDRENHAFSDPEGVGNSAMDYINKIIPTEAEMSAFGERMPKQKEPSGLDDPLTSFLLQYGPALATAKPTGGIIGTAVGAAKEPIANLLKDVKERKQLDYVTESDAFATLLEAKADALSGTSGKSYAALAIKDEIGNLVPEIANLKSQLQDENLSEADKNKLSNQLQTKQIQLNNLQKTNPNQEALVNAFFNSKPGQKYLQNTMTSLLTEDRKEATGKYKSEDDRQLLIDAIEDLREFINTELITGVGSRDQVKDGGRIGLQDGTQPVTEVQGGGQNMSQNDNPISFDQLRARLPQEITNDIVTLMSNSAEALNDFASISTQQDVNNFNKKFNVNLVLPAEA
tara:strand:+ start:66 stop:1139 length:1074 start_codon:yes stop_codon:yes gene_type:complete